MKIILHTSSNNCSLLRIQKPPYHRLLRIVRAERQHTEVGVLTLDLLRRRRTVLVSLRTLSHLTTGVVRRRGRIITISARAAHKTAEHRTRVAEERQRDQHPRTIIAFLILFRNSARRRRGGSER